jgi:hypothetical protein
MIQVRCLVENTAKPSTAFWGVLYRELSDNSEVSRRAGRLQFGATVEARSRLEGSNRRIFTVGRAQLARFWLTGQRKLRRCRDQRRAQNVADGQHPVGDAKSHGGRTVPIGALQAGDGLAQ